MMTAKAVNKLFCSELDATTVPLFHSQPGGSQLWPGCYITTDDSQSSNLMALRANDEFTCMLYEGRWRKWTIDCGPEVFPPPADLGVPLLTCSCCRRCQ
jgi:hypothetical protein